MLRRSFPRPAIRISCNIVVGKSLVSETLQTSAVVNVYSLTPDASDQAPTLFSPTKHGEMKSDETHTERQHGDYPPAGT